MTDSKLIIDLKTGRATHAPLTAAELEEAQAGRVKAAETEARESNARTIADALAVAMGLLADLQSTTSTITSKANSDIGPADVKALAREVRTLGAINRRVLRHILRDYTATD